jgi:hypothetical protein
MRLTNPAAGFAIVHARRRERHERRLARDGVHAQRRGVARSLADVLRLRLEERERIVAGRSARQHCFRTITANRIKSCRHALLHF